MILTIEEIRTLVLRVPALSESELQAIELLRPLSESALMVWIDQELGYSEHVELLPVGERIIERDELLDTRVEIHDGRAAIHDHGVAGNTLQLTHTPVWSLGLEVRVDRQAKAGQADGAFGAGSILSPGQSYWLDVDNQENETSRTGILYHASSWPSEPRTVQVTYFGGEKMGTEDLRKFGRALKLAALKIFEHNYSGFRDRQQNNGKGLVASERLGNWAASYRTVGAGDIGGSGVAIPDSVKIELWPFRRYSYM